MTEPSTNPTDGAAKAKRGPLGPTEDKFIAQLGLQRNKYSSMGEFIAKGFTIAPSRNVLRESIKTLKSAGSPLAGEVEAFYADTFGGPAGPRGRTAPQAGDIRIYSAQQIDAKNDKKEVVGAGLPFIRLTVSTLGIKRKGGVRVTYEKGRIIVEAAGAGEGANEDGDGGENEGQKIAAE